MHVILPIDTVVHYVDPETGDHRPARIKRQDTGSSAYIWLDEEGTDTAHARFSDGLEKGTLHLDRGEPSDAKPKPKSFKPGASKNGGAQAEAPAA